MRPSRPPGTRRARGGRRGLYATRVRRSAVAAASASGRSTVLSTTLIREPRRSRDRKLAPGEATTEDEGTGRGLAGMAGKARDRDAAKGSWSRPGRRTGPWEAAARGRPRMARGGRGAGPSGRARKAGGPKAPSGLAGPSRVTLHPARARDPAHAGGCQGGQSTQRRTSRQQRGSEMPRRRARTLCGPAEWQEPAARGRAPRAPLTPGVRKGGPPDAGRHGP